MYSAFVRPFPDAFCRERHQQRQSCPAAAGAPPRGSRRAQQAFQPGHAGGSSAKVMGVEKAALRGKTLVLAAGVVVPGILVRWDVQKVMGAAPRGGDSPGGGSGASCGEEGERFRSLNRRKMLYKGKGHHRSVLNAQ